MHVALIIDEERLALEQSMLNRLCIGMMAEGVAVTRIVPDFALPDLAGEAERRIALARRIEAPLRVLPWMRAARTSGIADQLEKSAPHVFYAIGEKAWPLGLELGKKLQRPVVIDVWSPRQVRQAPKVDHASAIAAYVTYSEPMARMLGRRVDPALVSVVPMGVALPAAPCAALTASDQPITMAVIGSARDINGYEAMLDGISRIMRDSAESQIFLELRGRCEHEVWRRAEKHNLLPFISAIGEASLYRRLIARCDLMLMPECYGELRSITLEAMALAIPVVARTDPALDLLNDQTAILVGTGDSEDWSARLRNALRHPEQVRPIAMQARRAMGDSHRSSDHVARLLTTLERACSGGVYKLPSQSP